MGLPQLLATLGLDVAPEAVVRLERLADELLRWSRRRNLTAITGRDEILEKHLVDSLTLLPFINRTGRLLDIGSGAGFPALPVKIACPDLEVVSGQIEVAQTLALVAHSATGLDGVVSSAGGGGLPVGLRESAGPAVRASVPGAPRVRHRDQTCSHSQDLA